LYKSGQKILLVDTGFFGIIPGVIKSYYSQEAQKNLSTHLIVSNSQDHGPAASVWVQKLIRALIEKGESSDSSRIVKYTFSKEHRKDQCLYDKNLYRYF
jgi:hypothetical protein